MTALHHLELQAFRQGFHAGADPSGKRRRHAVDPVTHPDWLRGYHAGQTMANEAAESFSLELEADSRGGGR